MKTTLAEMIKTLTVTRLEIERFKTSNLYPSVDINNFLQEITNTLLDLQEKVVDLQKEIER